jgi:hypothetical protein
MPFDAKHANKSWGGARNRADRVSHALPLAKAKSIIAAAYKAQASGLAFNRHVTIHWTAAGMADDQAAAATGRLIKLMSDWLRTKGSKAAWLWVRENDTGDGSKGSHVHILLHSPDTLPIDRMWRRWLRKVTAQPYRVGTVHTSRIGGTVNCYQSNPALYAVNLDAVLAYLCKGVNSHDGATLGLPRTEPGGRVTGKRAAWAQCLSGKTAGPYFGNQPRTAVTNPKIELRTKFAQIALFRP